MDSIKITKDMFVVLTYELYDDKSELLEKVDNPVTHIHVKEKSYSLSLKTPLKVRLQVMR